MTDLTKKLEALASDIAMLIAQWAAQDAMGVAQEALATVVVREIRKVTNALLALEAREDVGAVADVLSERTRQDAKWGEQNHDPIVYTTILTEEVGELAQAALHSRFGGSKKDGFRTEAVHCAAVALAIVECIDRNKWTWPKEAPHD